MSVTIGGSSAAAACGLDPFKSRARLWMELTGRVEPASTGEAAEWGARLEPMIAAAVDDRGYIVSRPGPREIGHTEHEWMTGTPDGFVAREGGPDFRITGLLEIKTAGLRMSRLWADGSLPVPYEIQVAHYLALTGLSWALVACLIGGQRLELREVERNEKLIGLMIEQEAEFVRLVETDTPPPPDGSPGYTAMLAQLFPNGHEPPVSLTPDQFKLVEDYRALRSAGEANKRALAETAQEIQTVLGDSTAAVHEGRVVARWSRVEPKARKVGKAQVERLAADHPELFEEFSYLPEPYRRFHVV